MGNSEGCNYTSQIWDAAYRHGDQWVQGVVVVIAMETWNFILANQVYYTSGGALSAADFPVVPNLH